MKEMGSVELMGSQLGLPGEEKSIERRKYSHMPHRGAVYHFKSVFVSFSFGKGVYLLSSVPWVGSVLQLGHTVMHTCTSTHKHNEICTQFLPRYIIISTKLHGVSWCAGLEVWKGTERDSMASLEQQADSLQCSAKGQRCHIHTIQCNSDVLVCSFTSNILVFILFSTVWSMSATMREKWSCIYIDQSKKPFLEPDKC